MPAAAEPFRRPCLTEVNAQPGGVDGAIEPL
jgi:hypothetical protein